MSVPETLHPLQELEVIPSLLGHVSVIAQIMGDRKKKIDALHFAFDQPFYGDGLQFGGVSRVLRLFMGKDVEERCRGNMDAPFLSASF
jgi:hypothetical protein